MGSDLELPASIAERATGSGGGGGSSAYGKERSDKGSEELNARLEELAPAVERLAALEWDAQTSFLMMQQRWSAAGGGTPSSLS